MAHVEDRRSFLRWLTHGLGAIFAAILGVPIIAYLIDPRNRKGASSEYRLVDGIRLNEVTGPTQGVIRDVRVDGWTLHPNDTVGRVWVVPDSQATNGFNVFTTICPHLGCSVNLGEGCFACPCHNAQFNLTDGDRINTPEHPNPALRGMDKLDWERDSADPERVRVRYKSYKTSVADRVVI